ncbi:MAG TPA: selenocysteine-specific translation elongation factor [Gemmatimonadales bacterium]|nr:selenocysteine-specific translation elongation factor [Gemmatimonadales bacterium]
MIVGTAGHIDHGKSALVEALTGRSVDRLAEERRRGITIDLNFAPLDLPGLGTVGVVDVPGHEDLIRTMVAGASGIDLVLLVVAGDEAIKPQTLEHLAVVEALRIPRGIPVITKADLVEPAWAELVAEEVATRLAGSPVRFERPAIVSARTGAGLDELRARIGATLGHATPRPGDALRIPVDRAFSVAGVGTVVTGTAWSGSVAVGDAVRLLPSGREARVRSVEMYGQAVERSVAGARVAVGLAGVEREAVARGDVLVTDALPWRAAGALDVELELSPEAPRPLAPRSRIRVHHGTAEVLARVATARAVAPGGAAVVRLVLEAPLVARGGDRFVIRSYSPVATIGGGRVLDPDPPRRSRPTDPGIADSEPQARLAALIARRRDGIATAEAGLLVPSGTDRSAPEGIRQVGDRLVAAVRLRELQERVRDLIARHHQELPASPGVPLETLRAGLHAPDLLAEAAITAEVRAGRVVVEGGVVRTAGFAPSVAGGDAALDDLVARLTSAGLTAPTVAELERETGRADVGAALRIAAGQGRVRAVTRDWFVATPAVEGFVAALGQLGATGPFSVGAVRDRLGLSRKYLIPLLEWADASGVTVRRGDLRELVRPRA